MITVFGCGGDRDRGKRPKMGRAAGEGSDFVVVTSDNPRSEDPLAIIEETRGRACARPGRALPPSRTAARRLRWRWPRRAPGTSSCLRARDTSAPRLRATANFLSTITRWQARSSTASDTSEEAHTDEAPVEQGCGIHPGKRQLRSCRGCRGLLHRHAHAASGRSVLRPQGRAAGWARLRGSRSAGGCGGCRRRCRSALRALPITRVRSWWPIPRWRCRTWARRRGGCGAKS